MSADKSRPGHPAIVIPDPWAKLAGITPARLALGRAGSALPTAQVLALAIAHARARDAVHAGLDATLLTEQLQGLGQEVVEVESAASSRDIYLARPDFGRRLSPVSRERLEALRRPAPDVSLIIADGLSATAVHETAGALLRDLLPILQNRGYALSPVVLARQARVALGDEIGDLLGSRMTVVLIGERPGLSCADSLSAYLTFAPAVGRTDAERNCVSNIRGAGLAPGAAALKIAWIIDRALSLALTGVRLKDDSEGSLESVRSPQLAEHTRPRS
jgi:ethanolamine ammonia-lyase small subunit